jgi:hypothetical protein
MDRAIPLLMFAAFLAAWTWFLYKRSGGRMWSPLWIAFSATATSLLFLTAGALGFTLSRHARFVAGTAWSDSVIWWEVWVGIGAALMAAYFWRRGLRAIRPSH